MLNEQFSGNEQQDAQEVLTFLLDGLSEDLNLVRAKPYIPQPDSDGRPDEVLADIWWGNHLARDFSIVQALFMGQFKSTMSCACGHSSARYEPFSVLPLPLPEETKKTFPVNVLPLASTFAIRVVVTVPKEGTLADVGFN